MIDIKLLREQPDMVREAMEKLNATDAPVDEAIRLDKRRRALLTELEALKAERNKGSKRIGQLMREGKREEAEALKARMAELSQAIAKLQRELKQVEQDLEWAMLNIPNLPLPEVPVGKDEGENVVVRVEGEMRTFDFTPKPHW
ncbi:MAG TPA: serine--tRNA ligase, partial [Anaerolineae bacterium]|nr:serine--tRNA ligase [Anaerolineae bacterium]